MDKRFWVALQLAKLAQHIAGMPYRDTYLVTDTEKEAWIDKLTDRQREIAREDYIWLHCPKCDRTYP